MQDPITQPPSHDESSSYPVDSFLGSDYYEALTIIIAAKVSSSLSLFGSCYVIQDILRDEEKRNSSIYHRTMLGVAVSDFIVALAVFLGTWPMEKAGYNIFAVGNDGTKSITTVGG